MRLVHHDEIPVSLLQLRLSIFIPTELVEPADGQIGLSEGVAAAGSLKPVVRENLEGEVKTSVQLILPLLNEATWADDQAAVQVAADQQFLNEEAGHNGLAGAGVVGQQEAQWLARQHLAIDRGDLVWQRLNEGGMYSQQRIEEISQVDAVGLGNQSEQRPIAVETPGKADSGDLEAGLAVAVENLVAEVTSSIAVGEGNGYITMPLYIHYRDEGIWEDTFYRCSPSQLLQLCHRIHLPLPIRYHMIEAIIH